MKTSISRLAILAAALTALSATAWAADPRASGVIKGSTVTVGDVFDGAGSYADRYLAPAPAPGSSLALEAADLERISEAFHLGWHSADGRERVVLSAAAHGADRYAIEAAIQEKLASELPGQKFDMQLPGGDLSISLPDSAPNTVEAEDVKINLQKGVFTAQLKAPAGETENPVRKEVSGRISLLTQVPVLKNPMRPGDVIGADNLDYVEMRANEVASNVIVDADRLIGQTPRRGIAAMKPISAADVSAPALVKQGELVTVALSSGALSLTLQGRALQSGAEGDIVRIVNTASNKILDGVVTGAQTVTVRTASSAL
jgi:flagella basal body P-ring formation protein FlgA